MLPEAGRAEDVARKIRIELEERGLLNEPVGVDAVELPVLFALQGEGIKVVDGQQLMQQARLIKTQDEITLLNSACMMVDAAYDELYRFMKPGVRENECVGLVSKILYDLGSEHVEGVNVSATGHCDLATQRTSTSCTALMAIAPVTTAPSPSGALQRRWWTLTSTAATFWI